MTRGRKPVPELDRKEFQGKKVFRAVKGLARISRVFVWDEVHSEYVDPQDGRVYRARRYDLNESGARVRVERFFTKVDEALSWQAGRESAVCNHGAPEVVGSMTFQDVCAEFRRKRFPSLEETTQTRYDDMLNAYFKPLLKVPVADIVPHTVDDWIAWLTDPSGRFMKSKKRISFKHELDLFSTLLRFYEDNHDDLDFRYPIKERHKAAVRLNRPSRAASKDMTVEENERLCLYLETGPLGDRFARMCGVQYEEALRISEVAGLTHQDIRLDLCEPSRSRMRITRRVVYPRKGGVEPYVKVGFKNADANDGIKELPIFPRAFEMLKPIWKPGCDELIFNDGGKPLTYRQIQYAYNRALKAAGLPYRSTHVMRHGGCRNIYNRYPDLDVAKQLLGNSSTQSTLVYAKRHKGALTSVAQQIWADHVSNKPVMPPEGPTPGRLWLVK